MGDLISRKALCEYALNQKDKSITPNDIMRFPSAQPKKRTEKRTETHACDLISRQAVIDIVQGYAEQLQGYIGMPNDSEVYAYARGLLLSIDRNIKALPSAQPEKRTNERTETHSCDLISRQAVIDAIFSEPLYKTGMKKRDADAVVPAIYEKIKSLPSAQPTGAPLHDSGSDYAHGFADGYKQGLKDEESERVRCKDCLYWVAHDKRCVYLNHGFAPNMWCCHGRRADG